MDMNMFYGILIPFVGTSAGAACVFFMKKDLNQWVQRCLTGFAAGVMVAASVWSLLIPAIEQVRVIWESWRLCRRSAGFWCGCPVSYFCSTILFRICTVTSREGGGTEEPAEAHDDACACRHTT